MDFDDRAGDWDTPRRRERAQAIANKIHSQIADKMSEPVLEFGCGTGLVSRILAMDFCDITLMDNAPTMINVATERVNAEGIRHLKPILFDLTKDVYPHPSHFGAIFTSMALHHVPDLVQLLSAFYTLLQPGGILCIVDLDPVDPAFHAEEVHFHGHDGIAHALMQQWLASTGFASTSIETFYYGEKKTPTGRVCYSLFCAMAKK